ncbi:MAG TPA: nucleoside recognition domain-containing protein [Candidatus Saccharimonadia bacterium]|nr:nucleoside recognition domain-containing protein [Candidatus Saccharimonadia bacterium]
MLNYVWSFLIVTGIIAAALFGRLEPMVSGVFDICIKVVMVIALPLAGTIMLWLGIMRVMEKGGMMNVVAKLLSPILRRLFPEVPKDHPAMGAITMNIAANMLGLGNAATPMGLKAMTHLQELNPNKQSASNAMCMFLALNTAGFTLLPMTSLNYLNAGGVRSPQEIIVPTILATICSTTAGIMAAMFFQRLPMFRSRPDDVVVPVTATATDESPKPEETATKPYKMSRLRAFLVYTSAVLFVFGAALEFLPEKRTEVLKATGLQTLLTEADTDAKAASAREKEIKGQTPVAVDQMKKEEPWWRKNLLKLSTLTIPLILLGVVLWALARGIPVFEEMAEGAKEGFGVVTRIMPFLLVMFVAIACFRDSGALMLLEYVLRPVLSLIGMPVDLFPLAIMRPLSGSGSSGFLNEIIFNPQSTDHLRYTAAILFGSTETTFYVLAVYFGSVSIRRTRHALAAGLCADAVGMTVAIFLGWLLFASR